MFINIKTIMLAFTFAVAYCIIISSSLYKTIPLNAKQRSGLLKALKIPLIKGLKRKLRGERKEQQKHIAVRRKSKSGNMLYGLEKRKR